MPYIARSGKAAESTNQAVLQDSLRPSGGSGAHDGTLLGTLRVR